MSNQIIIEKIRALMAKANDAGATEAESIAFMNKALELLAKHNLSEGDLADKDIKVGIEETEFKILADLKWFQSLAATTAQMYFCKTYRRARYVPGRKTLQHYVVFCGKEHNRLMAVSMFEYLMKAMHRLATTHSNDVKIQYEFKKGASIRLAWRVFEINKKNAAPVTTVSTGLPVLYKTELALVDDYMNKLDLSNRTRNTSLKAGNGFRDGQEAANSISLNNQVGASTSAYLLR